MDDSLYRWINDTWTGAWQRKSAALVELGANGERMSRRELPFTLLTETVIPACDASSKEAGFLALKLRPERVTKAQTGGKLSESKQRSQPWVLSNFRFQIQGIDTTSVSRIEPFVVRLRTKENTVGDSRKIEFSPTTIDFGSLRVTLPAKSAATWAAWAENFTVKGNSDDAHEKSATLGLLSADLKTYLAHVDFFNVGVFGYADLLPPESGPKQVVADLSCERAEFHLGAPSSGGGICPTNPCILPAGA